MQFHDIEQGSMEWFEKRRGIPTASRFDMIVTPVQGKPSAQQRKLIVQLIAERFGQTTPERVESYTSRAMAEGIENEPKARACYQAFYAEGLAITNGGFCLSDCGRWGASPDGLVGTDGCLELKCPQEETHIGYLLDGTLPSDYRCQVHGHLIVTGRAWCDFLSYHAAWPELRIRVVADEFTELLRSALVQFDVAYRAALEKIRGMAA